MKISVPLTAHLFCVLKRNKEKNSKIQVYNWETVH